MHNIRSAAKMSLGAAFIVSSVQCLVIQFRSVQKTAQAVKKHSRTVIKDEEPLGY